MDIFFETHAFIAALALYTGAAVLSLFAGWQLHDGGKTANRVAHFGACLASLLILIFSIGVFLGGEGKTLSFASPFPGISFDFRIDGLSAFFLGLIGGIAALASWFGVAYQKHFIGKYDLGSFGFFPNNNCFLVSSFLGNRNNLQPAFSSSFIFPLFSALSKQHTPTS